jgi:hypothetical protein
MLSFTYAIGDKCVLPGIAPVGFTIEREPEEEKMAL